MVKRVIQTTPDIGLTIRLPKRQTVVQQVGTVAPANPGAPVWLGWQGQGGEACARLIYPCAIPLYHDIDEHFAVVYANIPPWPYPQAWLAGVPPQDTSSDDWRICQRITCTARATLKIRTLDLDVPREEEIDRELILREAQTVWEREIDLDVPAATWPDGLYRYQTTGDQADIEPIEPDPLNCCQWTAPPEGLPFAPPRYIAPGGRQLLRLTRDDFDFARITISGVYVQIEPGATDMERDAVLMANLPAVIPFDRAGTLLVTTAAYNVIGSPNLMFDTDLHCTAHDEDGRALGDVSLHLPLIHFEKDVMQ